MKLIQNSTVLPKSKPFDISSKKIDYNQIHLLSRY